MKTIPAHCSPEQYNNKLTVSNSVHPGLFTGLKMLLKESVMFCMYVRKSLFNYINYVQITQHIMKNITLVKKVVVFQNFRTYVNIFL